MCSMSHDVDRAARPPLRHRHLPLHRRRGLDAAAARTRRRGLRRGARRAPARDPRGLRPPTTESRSTRRATPSSSPSRPLRVRSPRPRMLTEASRRARSACASACTRHAASGRGGLRRRRRQPRRPHRRGRPRRAGARLRLDRPARRARADATSASTGSRISPLPSASTSSETATSRRSSRLYRTNLPVPATPFLGREQELAEVVELLPRGRAPAHADRTGRDRQDATRAAGSRTGLRRLPRRGLLGPARAAARSRARPRDRRPDARLQERPRRAHRRQGDALPVRQLRAGGGGGTRARGTGRRLPEPRHSRHEPRAPARLGRADLPRAPSRRVRTGRRSS